MLNFTLPGKISDNDCSLLINHSLLTEQQIISVARVLEHKSAEADVSEVFQPLEVWNGDASGVDVDVGQYQHLTPTNKHGISVNRGHVLQFVSQQTTDPQRF